MKKIIGLLSLALIIFACEEPDNTINGVLDDYQTGAVLRTIASSGEYNYNAPDSSVFTATIEEHDDENGALMQDVEIYVSHNGGSEALYGTLSPADFTVGPTGLPRTELTVSLGTAMSILGKSKSDYTGGDVVNIRLVLNLTDGRSFSTESVTGSMTGSYFKSPYAYSRVIKCIPLGAVPGVYTINLTDTYGDGWNGAYLSVVVDGVETKIGIPTWWAGEYEDLDLELTPNLDQAFPAGTYVSAYADATATFTIPEGASTMSFSWVKGDWDSEVIYSIDYETLTGTDAQTAYSDSNPAAGEKVLSICL